MRLIRLISTVAVLGALAWTGWWYVLARGQELALAAWFEDRTRAGWQAEHDGIDLAGFPLLLTREVSGVRLADPETGWAWAAPWLRIESAPFAPGRFDVTWPSAQSLAVPGERTDIATDRMTAHLELRPGASLGLVRASADLSRLEVRSQAGWTGRAGSVTAKVAERVNDDGYSIELLAEKLVLPQPVMKLIDPTGLVGRDLERLTYEGSALFDAPLDRHLIEDGRLALKSATVRRAGFQWGQMRLEAKGRIRVNERGCPEGKLDLTMRHWREIVTLGQRAGMFGKDIADAVVTALELVALLGGDRDELDAPLNFADCDVRLGPVRIGRAPRLAPPRS